MVEKFSFDHPRVSRDEATELCVYHLRMAAALFQVVPEDNNEALRAEILRQTKDDLEEVDRTPAMLWAAAMFAAYDKMKDRD